MKNPLEQNVASRWARGSSRGHYPNPADTAFRTYPCLGRPTGITKSGGSGLLVVPLARPTRGNYQIRRIHPIGRTPGSADPPVNYQIRRIRPFGRTSGSADPRELPNPADTVLC